jgi:glycosyltransferase involved in cell wall biosynthesis
VLNGLVKAIQPDIVHAHFSSTIFSTALAMKKHWPITIGTFQGVHFLLSEGAAAPLTRLAETWAVNRLDHAWVLSQDDLDGLRLAAPHARISKQDSYGFGCDLQRFDCQRYSLDERRNLRRQLGLGDEHFVFTFPGRYVYFKGFDVAVRAFLELAQAEPDIRLLLMGLWDEQHPAGLTRSEQQALKDSSLVIDLGWQTEFEKYFAITDVVLFPSEREGMPVSIMAALAMGVPVITRDSRGCRDVVRDGVDGVVIDSFSIDKLVLEMRKLKEDEALRQRLSAGSLAGRERFSKHHYTAEQIRIYGDLLTDKIPRQSGA